MPECPLLQVGSGPGGSSIAWPLSSRAQAQALEAQALLAHPKPPGSLMARAGADVARLARAIAPHARSAWVMVGPGNNGGDGLVAAVHLAQLGWQVTVTRSRPDQAHQDDAAHAWQGLLAARDALAHPDPAMKAQQAVDPGSLSLSDTAPDLGPEDIIIDALLGLGATGAPKPAEAALIQRAHQLAARTRLAVDLPSGLCADTGTTPGIALRATHTLCLLTIKRGLWTAQGKDHAGQVWWAALSHAARALAQHRPSAWLWPSLHTTPAQGPAQPHAHHKGSHGDTLVLGGDTGMTGAAYLAAASAARAGSGKVHLCVLDPSTTAVPPALATTPTPASALASASALAFASAQAQAQAQTQALAPPPSVPWHDIMLAAADPVTLRARLRHATVVAGCGGGQAIARFLDEVLRWSPRLVLDADGLNALAAFGGLTALQARGLKGQCTVLTPHPLEAARLLGCSAHAVQSDRFQHAQAMADAAQAVVVLKGSGTVIAAPGCPPVVNQSGSAALAVAGTGDVLAGWLGGHWSRHAHLVREQPPPSDMSRLQAMCADVVAAHGVLGERLGPLMVASDMVTHAARHELALGA